MPTEADTCRRFVVPKLQAAGWDNEPYSIAEQRTITDGRIVLEQIEKDPRSFVDSLTDREAKGPPIVLPDGTTATRLPGFKLWLWDTEFCGSIGLRWQPGISELPAHVLGHIGYAVVPWKAGCGYAKRALKLMLEHARAEGLQYVEITTDPDNVASRRVIEANSGVLVERFPRPAQYGGTDALLFRIAL
jgi:predicted acetyltransferase